MRYIGIDPGKSGGIAYVDDSGNFDAWKIPATERDTLDIIAGLACDGSVRAIIEKVASRPGQGVVSMFTFGQNYGMLRAFLVASFIPFEAVPPGTWQREFSLIDPKATKTQKKNKHKAHAQQLFPGIKITHANADALLIAEYCKRHAV